MQLGSEAGRLNGIEEVGHGCFLPCPDYAFQRVVGESPTSFRADTRFGILIFSQRFRISLFQVDLPMPRFRASTGPSKAAVQGLNRARFTDAVHTQRRHRQCFRACCACFTRLVAVEVKSQDRNANILTCILTFLKWTFLRPSIASFLLAIC